MNDKKEQMGGERWYPLTYPGYYTESLTVDPSLCCEHCRLDVTPFRGETIGVNAVSTEQIVFSALTDDAGGILARWNEIPETIYIPANARFLYLNNRYDQNPDFYLSVPADKFKKADGYLFYEDFTGGAVLDGNDFLNIPPVQNHTSKGLVLPCGIENALVMHKSTALDGWCLTAELTAVDGTEVICLGTRITQERVCPHASLCRLDLGADELCLFKSGTGREMPLEIVQRISLAGLVGKGEFTLKLERLNTAVRASVIVPATGAQVSITQPLFQEETSTTIAGGCRAGKMYDSAQVFALSGAPVLRRLYASANVAPTVVFFGDSITQGAHNLPENGWAQMCAAEIGNSVCCGRGSGDIWSCLNQVRSLLPVFRPKAMVVTIGTNNQSTTTSVQTVKKLYEKFIRIAEHYGVILILNCIPFCGREHIAETNCILRSLDTHKCRFDVALVEGDTQISDYYAADRIHLSPAGNRVLYQRFMQDFSWLRNL